MPEQPTGASWANATPGLRLAVVAGGAVGTLARWALSLLPRPNGLPVGTLAANVVGALLLGALLARLGPRADDARWSPVTAGVLGGLTTFSTLVLEVVLWWPDDPIAAGCYLAGTVVLGLLAVGVGTRLGAPTGRPR